MFLETMDVDGQKPEVLDITNDNDQNVKICLKNILFYL